MARCNKAGQVTHLKWLVKLRTGNNNRRASPTDKAPAWSAALALSGPKIIVESAKCCCSALARNAPFTAEPKTQGQPVCASRMMGKSITPTDALAPA